LYSFLDFINKYTQQIADKLTTDANVYTLIKCLLRLTENSKEDGWIEYGLIKKVCDGNPAQAIETALSTNVLVKKNNQYRFRNKLIHNAAVLAKQ